MQFHRMHTSKTIRKTTKNIDNMKKIVLAMAAFAFSFGVMSAQDLATATATYNSGAEALTMGNKTSALEYFQKALTMAQSLGDEGADEDTNSKSAIPSDILSIGKDIYINKAFTNAKAKFEESIKVAGEYGNTEIVDEATGLLPTVAKRIALGKVNDAMKARDVAGVLAAYEEAIAIDTTDANTALKYGQFLGNAGKYDDAVKYLEMAARNGQEANAKSVLSTTFLKNAAAQLKAGKYADAVELAEKAISYKENAQAYLVAGQASQKSSKNADAISYFEKYLEAAPTAKNAGAIAFTVGALYQQAGNKAKAVEFYKQVENDPQFGAQAKPLIASHSK